MSCRGIFLCPEGRLIHDEFVMYAHEVHSCACGLFFQESARSASRKERLLVKRQITGLVVAAIIMGASAGALKAQNAPGQGRNGQGYGGPPASEQERAARQAACAQKNGGVCPGGGPRSECAGQGMRRGKCNGAGVGARQGLRDGTGPRAAKGTCPLQSQAPSQK